MPFSLIPDQVFARYTDLTPQVLKDFGVELLAEPDGTLHTWLEGCREAGITVMILSNNRSSRRVETFCSQLGIRYVGHAGKPKTRGYREAMAIAGASREETAMVGDKLLTDVLGARRSGVLALMVEPLGGAVTLWQKVLHALQSPFKALCRRRGGQEV